MTDYELMPLMRALQRHQFIVVKQLDLKLIAVHGRTTTYGRISNVHDIVLIFNECIIKFVRKHTIIYIKREYFDITSRINSKNLIVHAYSK